MATIKFTPLGADGKPIQSKKEDTTTTGNKILFTPLRADGKPINSTEPIKEREKPKPTLGQKAKKLGGEIIKGVVEPVATLVARPVQLGAELVMKGDNTEAINKFTKEKFGDYVAPVPQNASDVVKDIGRAAQTVTLSRLPKVSNLVDFVGGGALGGAGYAVEEGGLETTAKDLITNTAVGAGLGLGFFGAGKVIKGLNKKGVQEIIPETKTTPNVKVEPNIAEVIPTGKTIETPKTTPKVEEVIPVTPKKEKYKFNEQQYKKAEDFAENVDPEYKKGNAKFYKAEFDTLSKQDILDIATGVKQESPTLPATIVKAFARELPDLTKAERNRLARTTFVESQGGAKLQGAKYLKDEVINDPYSYTAKKQQELVDKALSEGYTNKTINRFLDDLTC